MMSISCIAVILLAVCDAFLPTGNLSMVIQNKLLVGIFISGSDAVEWQ